mmetsp:Transcript_31238/g.46188  ORF Transcript_31238/g.46188 Transcript_31238/m.46188 type:complete len:360 (+) Transcript_31238:546-1625(+)|eukprot:CAMPEP_0195520632 /NCGR_PEP_ID=MMETSP0794_2-20130614/17313_1 /TAXON_ID=515487 /ORGANISM="Stephanopyxis turris, Strain CCMP 815" /LENGTH=359 /DNA_ID=CAMNT_0040650031 /DNA_START=543 /DNA_END=1622 /DNA_ORIENTATION=-
MGNVPPQQQQPGGSTSGQHQTGRGGGSSQQHYQTSQMNSLAQHGPPGMASGYGAGAYTPGGSGTPSNNYGGGGGSGGYSGNYTQGGGAQQSQQSQHAKHRSASDVSMSDAHQQHGGHNHNASPMGGQNYQNHMNQFNSQQQQQQQNNRSGGNDGGESPTLQFDNDEAVPTVFRWEHGGRQVYITGTFNDWSRQIPMHRSGNDFTYIHNLRKGKHAFKFIVDDEWRFAPDQPTVADIEGRINNFIDVSDFKPYVGDKDFEERVETQTEHPMNAKEEVFSHTMPDLDEYTKEPPPLPPHLRHIILNKAPQLSDTAALPVPQHVALNHLYCTAIKDNMMVLGITQRYKTKFVTTVYYSPCST